MGIIAPEKKKKQRSSSPNMFGLFLMILFAVGIPFFSVRSCTSRNVSRPVRQSAQKTSVSSYTKDSKGYYERGTKCVLDTAGILTASQNAEISAYLTDLNDRTGVQIVVFTVQSLNGEDEAQFAIDHANRWKLGQKGVDNGALLFVSMEEHSVYIYTGDGTEGVLTDALCGRIVRNVIIPRFRSGDYAGGIMEGVKNMAGIITSDETLVAPDVSSAAERSSEDDDISAATFIFALVIVWILFTIVMSSSRGRRRRGFIPPVIFMGGSNFGHDFSGHSHGSSSSHSGFSGGGGRFSGGGAGGHW